jgi:hypothetical protein
VTLINWRQNSLKRRRHETKRTVKKGSQARSRGAALHLMPLYKSKSGRSLNIVIFHRSHTSRYSLPHRLHSLDRQPAKAEHVIHRRAGQIRIPAEEPNSAVQLVLLLGTDGKAEPWTSSRPVRTTATCSFFNYKYSISKYLPPNNLFFKPTQ